MSAKYPGLHNVIQSEETGSAKVDWEVGQTLTHFLVEKSPNFPLVHLEVHWLRASSANYPYIHYKWQRWVILLPYCLGGPNGHVSTHFLYMVSAKVPNVQKYTHFWVESYAKVPAL